MTPGHALIQIVSVVRETLPSLQTNSFMSVWLPYPYFTHNGRQWTQDWFPHDILLSPILTSCHKVFALVYCCKWWISLHRVPVRCNSLSPNKSNKSWKPPCDISESLSWRVSQSFWGQIFKTPPQMIFQPPLSLSPSLSLSLSPSVQLGPAFSPHFTASGSARRTCRSRRNHPGHRFMIPNQTIRRKERHGGCVFRLGHSMKEETRIWRDEHRSWTSTQPVMD